MKIALEFNKNLIALAGTAHGDETWHTQVEPYKDEPQLTLKFPDHIECISTSFVSALLAQELEEYGLRLIKIRGRELVRGRGGPRCMSMPFERENL